MENSTGKNEATVSNVTNETVSKINEMSSADENRSTVSFTVAEAYKSIRTNIKFLLSKKTGNIITISGSDIGEGK